MTYSIVARDPDTGELGVAVQSHWFSVGSIVTSARPGVGAVATQANAEVTYGPAALELLSCGVPAPDALELLFWAGLGTAQAGDLEAGVAKVREAITLQPTWRELLLRSPQDLTPAAQAVLARVDG